MASPAVQTRVKCSSCAAAWQLPVERWVQDMRSFLGRRFGLSFGPFLFPQRLQLLADFVDLDVQFG